MGTSLVDSCSSSVSVAHRSLGQSFSQHLFIQIPPPARNGTINAEQAELFKKQIACLNFPEDFHSYDGTTGQWTWSFHRVEVSYSGFIIQYETGRGGGVNMQELDVGLSSCSIPVSLFSCFQSCVLTAKPASEQQRRVYVTIRCFCSQISTVMI